MEGAELHQAVCCVEVCCVTLGCVVECCLATCAAALGGLINRADVMFWLLARRNQRAAQKCERYFHVKCFIHEGQFDVLFPRRLRSSDGCFDSGSSTDGLLVSTDYISFRCQPVGGGG